MAVRLGNVLWWMGLLLGGVGSVRGVVGIMSGIISENLMIAYYAERSNC